jgi:uncharacterized protein YrrD
VSELSLGIGVQVHCRDGRVGTLVKVVANPEQRQVTDLIVEKGFLLKRDRIFPLSDVDGATETEIHLAINSSDIADYPEYRTMVVEEPDPDAGRGGDMGGGYGTYVSAPVMPMVKRRVHEGVVTGRIVLGRHTKVVAADLGKAFGHVARIGCNADNGRITDFVIQRGLIPEHFMLPASAIKEINEENLVLATSDGLDQLPRYTAKGTVEVVADGGGGAMHVPAERDVPVEAQVFAALAADPRTTTSVIEVINDRGVITLQGAVDRVRVRNAAEEIALEQPGVTAVVNELVIRIP